MVEEMCVMQATPTTRRRPLHVACSMYGGLGLDYSQCNKRQARAQNFFAPISINLVPKVV